MDPADHSTLRASPGDRLVVRGHRQGEPERDAEVLEVLGEDGAPPYLVRWEDGHESEVFPGSDVVIQHLVGSDERIDEDRARELLARERQRVEGSLENLERARQGEVDEIETATDPADDAELIEEAQVDDALVVQLRGELDAIERAEARLRDGTYGLSVESGEPIPAARLEAIPWAERTAEEQARLE